MLGHMLLGVAIAFGLGSPGIGQEAIEQVPPLAAVIAVAARRARRPQQLEDWHVRLRALRKHARTASREDGRQCVTVQVSSLRGVTVAEDCGHLLERAAFSRGDGGERLHRRWCSYSGGTQQRRSTSDSGR